MIMEIDKLEQKRVERAKKNLLWFGIISLTMSFAGLTSAYVVSKERPDWISDFEIPPAFYISLGIILISSLTIHMAKVSIKKNLQSRVMMLLITTFLLGIAFVFFPSRVFLLSDFTYRGTGPPPYLINFTHTENISKQISLYSKLI